MKYLSPFETYKLFLGIKFHFTKKAYDAVKYRFKVNVKQSTFDKRNDKYHFAKLGKKLQTEDRIISYIVSNLSEDPNMWIGDMNDDRHNKRIGRIQAIDFHLDNDLSRITRDARLINTLISPGQLPDIIQDHMRGGVCLETVTILNDCLHFIDKIDFPVDLWENKHRVITKYGSFLDYDKQAARSTIKKFLQS